MKGKNSSSRKKKLTNVEGSQEKFEQGEKEVLLKIRQQGVNSDTGKLSPVLSDAYGENDVFQRTIRHTEFFGSSSAQTLDW